MPNEIDESMFDDLRRMSRLVRDSYCTNKLYQVLALLHNARYEFEVAKPYAHVAYGYFDRLNNTLERGICAHILGTAYQHTGHLEEAQYWYMRSAEFLAETNNTRQYTTVALTTASLKITMKELDIAEQFADIGIREARKTNSRIHEATGWHLMAIINGMKGDINAAYEAADEARNFYEEMENETQLQHMEHTMALIEAREGKTADALKRLGKMIRDLERVPEGNSFRKQGIESAKDLIQKIQSGEIAPVE